MRRADFFLITQCKGLQTLAHFYNVGLIAAEVGSVTYSFNSSFSGYSFVCWSLSVRCKHKTDIVADNTDLLFGTKFMDLLILHGTKFFMVANPQVCPCTTSAPRPILFCLATGTTNVFSFSESNVRCRLHAPRTDP